MVHITKANLHKYNLHEWEIIEDCFVPENNYVSETIFTTGNGFIGMRGSFEENRGDASWESFDGTFLNGIYETGTIRYGEIAYGFPEISQTMINVANAKAIRLFIEDEEFSLKEGQICSYKRILDMKNGLMKRELRWRSPKGKEIDLCIERLVSLSYTHIAALSYRVVPVNFNGRLRLVSAIDGHVKNGSSERDPRVGAGFEDEVLTTTRRILDINICALEQITHNSSITIFCAMVNNILTQCPFEVKKSTSENTVEISYEIAVKKNTPICLEKFISYSVSKDFKDEPGVVACSSVEHASSRGFDGLKRDQKKYLDAFWNKADIEIQGDLALQQAIRFNLFHLLQSVGKDGRTNISAKGLTGEGYEGHYFWDTEMYVLPTFLYSSPKISRRLLEYRYHTLDQARARAKEMAHPKGALFPWRTIDGRECSAYYPAGTAQYHINADIAFAVRRYMDATQDEDFLLAYGAEILIETARLWADLGFFNPAMEGKFCIHCVTGPDEYTAVVNNNCYTNLMAKENLSYAVEVIDWLRKNHKAQLEELALKLRLEESEVVLWKEASEKMYIPYNEKLGLYPQDDSFLEKKVWDFENTSKDKYPLLLHFHPLVIYRHQVCKQADLILAMFLLSHRFTKEEKARNFNYYEKITTHDSSLSSCIFCIVACDIGYYDKAYEFFIRTARMDLDDYQGNTAHGVHTANMAGSWMCIVNGFGGMRTHDGSLYFSPYLPKKWESYSFRVLYRGRLIKVTVSKQHTQYELLDGDEISIFHRNQEFSLKKNGLTL